MPIFSNQNARRVVLVLSLALAARAQETLSGVQRELDRVERETEREKDLDKAERGRAAEFETRKNEKLQALRDQMKATDRIIDSLKRAMEFQKGRKVAKKNEAAQFQARQKEFRDAIGREIETMKAWLEKDFPYQKEKRLSDWDDLAKANQEASLPVEETLARLFSLVQTSMDFAQDTEVYPGTYTATDGDQSEGTYVRLGAVMLAFASSDGQRVAYLSKSDKGYEWKDKDLSSDARNGVLTAVQVAQGKVAPQLVALPLAAPKVKAVGQ
ncbi:MAG TPA: hypothetical protein DCQ83_04670 [Fibrobacteres bacterium]|jgi:hypothetical protein|nr:hypothetical protein [Fibrobacterota bacterium]